MSGGWKKFVWRPEIAPRRMFPRRRIRRTGGSAGARERPCMPPMRFPRLQSVVCRIDPRVVGLPAAPPPVCFHPCGQLSRPTVPRASQRGFILSCRLSSSEFLRPSSRPSPFEVATPARVSSLFAASPAASTRRVGTPAHATFRPRVFSTPRRFAPPPASRAYSIPLPRPGFLPSRGFSPTRSRPDSSSGRAPMSLPPSRSPDFSGCHVGASRLRGLAPRVDAFRRFGS